MVVGEISCFFSLYLSFPFHLLWESALRANGKGAECTTLSHCCCLLCLSVAPLLQVQSGDPKSPRVHQDSLWSQSTSCLGDCVCRLPPDATAAALVITGSLGNRMRLDPCSCFWLPDASWGPFLSEPQQKYQCNRGREQTGSPTSPRPPFLSLSSPLCSHCLSRDPLINPRHSTDAQKLPAALRLLKALMDRILTLCSWSWGQDQA